MEMQEMLGQDGLMAQQITVGDAKDMQKIMVMGDEKNADDIDNALVCFMLIRHCILDIPDRILNRCDSVFDKKSSRSEIDDALSRIRTNLHTYDTNNEGKILAGSMLWKNHSGKRSLGFLLSKSVYGQGVVSDLRHINQMAKLAWMRAYLNAFINKENPKSALRDYVAFLAISFTEGIKDKKRFSDDAVGTFLELNKNSSGVNDSLKRAFDYWEQRDADRARLRRNEGASCVIS